MNRAWYAALANVYAFGQVVAPRGKPTREALHYTTTVDMRRPVLTLPARWLGYRFMAAEAYWILSGDNRVETIAPWSKRIAEFSDDGWTFFGAYGPKIHEQLDHVIRTLTEDPLSRQAVINIWRENPPPTKDVPCTVALSFMIRCGLLELSVFMRSSDLWLGLPYDCFNFSMLAHLVCACLNEANSTTLEPGSLRLTAASSHLYEPHWEVVEQILRLPLPAGLEAPTPEELFLNRHRLMARLKDLREPNAPGRWWEP